MAMKTLTAFDCQIIVKALESYWHDKGLTMPEWQAVTGVKEKLLAMMADVPVVEIVTA